MTPTNTEPPPKLAAPVPAPGGRPRWTLAVKLALLFSALLGLVQTGVYLASSLAISRIATGEVSERLEVGAKVFRQVFDQDRRRLQLTASVLSADFAFREAIATNDVPTMLSVLSNHGQRINADVMMLAGLNDIVVADTQSLRGVRNAGNRFPFPDLSAAAERDGQASGTVVMKDGNPYQLVVLPVLAPRPIARLAVGFRIDAKQARELKAVTGLDVSFVHLDGDGRVYTSTLAAAELPALGEVLRRHENISIPFQADFNGEAYEMRVVPLTDSGGSRIAAVLQSPLAETLAPFNLLNTTLFTAGSIALLLGILGSVWVARHLTRPVARLTLLVDRIGRGEFSLGERVRSNDEIGHLAKRFDAMREGLAERESRILDLTYMDPLTGLPNRTRLVEAVHERLRQASPCSILYLNLDRFALINQTLGHAFGDRVLNAVGRRIRDLLQGDALVARAGGDEFAVLLSNQDPANAEALARALAAALERPLVIDDHPVDVGAAIGVAHAPAHAGAADEFLRAADAAMQVAKARRAPFVVFEPEKKRAGEGQLSLLTEMRHAISNNEFALYYQPKINLASGQLSGVEALIRWHHPTLGLRAPDSFIPFAEQTGYIRQLTGEVIRMAAQQAAEWRRAGEPLEIAFNLSPRDLLVPDLPRRIQEAVARFGGVIGDLCCEVTESSAMEDPEIAVERLGALRELGLTIAIDDFGTGYSSLSYLQRLPASGLKIDQSFVRHMNARPQAATIVRSTIELAHSLGLSVTAEGVEDVETLTHLKAWGCDYGQGYFFGRPMPAADFDRWRGIYGPALAVVNANTGRHATVAHLFPVGKASGDE
ncbi:MAG TPA: EAL domain-containing protein [Burkholderiales bacterium]|jgi:diguanylate cyclase (GGDEF)-like protein|nr:EAL domain-containing protein [Burkholderiales bacterium]